MFNFVSIFLAPRKNCEVRHMLKGDSAPVRTAVIEGNDTKVTVRLHCGEKNTHLKLTLEIFNCNRLRYTLQGRKPARYDKQNDKQSNECTTVFN